ncbi:MAG: hypothetical protein Rhims3KO_18240 [Hyphomicrobiales bacterium]
MEAGERSALLGGIYLWREFMFNLTDHRIYAFSVFTRDFDCPLDRLTLRDLVVDSEAPSDQKIPSQDYERTRGRPVPCWIPEALKPAASDHYPAKPLLQLRKNAKGTDLSYPVQQLISNPDTEDASNAIRCKVYGWTEQTKKILTRGALYGPPAEGVTKEQAALARPYHALALPLTPSTLERLKRANSALLEQLPRYQEGSANNIKHTTCLPIRIVDLHIYHFETGKVVCQLAIELDVPPEVVLDSEILVETVDACGRLAKLRWLQVPATLPSKASWQERYASANLLSSEEFSIGSLLARVSLGGRGFWQLSLRTFTLSYAQVAHQEPAPSFLELERLGALLARQINSDYALRSGAGTETVADFDNVVHIMGREGAASIVYPETSKNPVVFLDDYRAKTLEQNYVPLVVLNLHQLHQMHTLQSRAVDAQGIIEVRKAPDERFETIHDEWQHLQEDRALLHARFRFLEPSRISMHNRYNAVLRETLGLVSLESQLKSDLDEMAERVKAAIVNVRSRQRQQFEQSFKFVPALIAAFGVCLFSLEFAGAIHTFREDGWDRFEIGVIILTAFLSICSLIYVQYRKS